MKLKATYTRRILAMMYFPDCEPQNAVRRLTSEIKRCVGVFKFVKWGQWPDTALLPLRRGSFPSYEGCDMYHSIEKPIDSLPLIFNTFMSFCLLHTKCKPSCLKQIIYHILFCLPESHLLSS